MNGTEVSFMAMESLHENGTISLDVVRPVEDVRASYSAFEDGDVVFAKVTPCFENGKAALVYGLSYGVGFGTTEVTVLRSRTRMDAKYLYYLTIEESFRQGGIASMTGAGGLKRVSDRFVKDFSFALPPLDEQRQIAEYLDRETAQIDALIVKQEQLVETLTERRQAVIAEAVTRGLNPDLELNDSGANWIAETPSHWSAAALRHNWRVMDCKHVTAEVAAEGAPLASIREVQSRFVDLSGAKRTSAEFFALLVEGDREPRPGDLLFSRNATVGKVAQVPEKSERFAMGQDVCLLRPIAGGMLPAYTQHVLQSPVVTTQMDVMMIGSTFKRLNVEQIRAFLLPVPPVDEQLSIVEYLDDATVKIDTLISKAREMAAVLRERRQALISAAVTGKIDVRGL